MDLNDPKVMIGGPVNSLSRSQRWLLVCLVVICWLSCTVAQVEKYLSLSHAAIVCGLSCLTVAACLNLLRVAYHRRLDLGVWALVVVFAVLASSFAVLYPRAQHHAPGKGSDREDALRVELVAVMHHQYPYSARTFLNHPPTPLPGAMWLAAPFFFAGRVALQNLFWAAIFFVFLTKFFRYRSTAVCFVLLFLFTALENLNDFDVGGDYITNILYLSVAVFWFCRTSSARHSTLGTVLAVVLMGFALSSRVLYAVVLPPLTVFVLQRHQRGKAFLLIGGVLLTAAAVTIPVFAPHPLLHLREQLNQNADKLSLLPAWLSGMTLPLVALLVSSTACLMRVDLRRIFLYAGMGSLILVLPPMMYFVHAEGGPLHLLTTDLEYLAAPALLLCLWAFSVWEEDGLLVCDDRVESQHGLIT